MRGEALHTICNVPVSLSLHAHLHACRIAQSSLCQEYMHITASMLEGQTHACRPGLTVCPTACCQLHTHLARIALCHTIGRRYHLIYICNAYCLLALPLSGLRCTGAVLCKQAKAHVVHDRNATLCMTNTPSSLNGCAAAVRPQVGCHLLAGGLTVLHHLTHTSIRRQVEERHTYRQHGAACAKAQGELYRRQVMPGTHLSSKATMHADCACKHTLASAG